MPVAHVRQQREVVRRSKLGPAVPFHSHVLHSEMATGWTLVEIRLVSRCDGVSGDVAAKLEFVVVRPEPSDGFLLVRPLVLDAKPSGALRSTHHDLPTGIDDSTDCATIDAVLASLEHPPVVRELQGRLLPI